MFIFFSLQMSSMQRVSNEEEIPSNVHAEEVPFVPLSNVAVRLSDDIEGIPSAEDVAANEEVAMLTGLANCNEGKKRDVQIKVRRSRARSEQLKKKKDKESKSAVTARKTLKQRKMEVQMNRQAAKQRKQPRRNAVDASYSPPTYVKNVAIEGNYLSSSCQEIYLNT